MQVQNIVFPNRNICEQIDMYFDLLGSVSVDMERQQCIFQKDGIAKTDTYFNSFSVGKWRKYTILNQLLIELQLAGSFLIQLFHARKRNDTVQETKICEAYFSEGQRKDYALEIPELQEEGCYYIVLKALEDGAAFYGGAYITEIEESALPNIGIAIGICTYHREEYVEHNIACFREFFIDNQQSPLYGHLEILISDNGKTLSSNLQSEHIRIFPNKNLGGAGGFTRTMIEAKRMECVCRLTHLLLMDDDVCIDPQSILRTYRFLQLLKEEYRDAFIGGAMLRLDQRSIQSEQTGYWEVWEQHPVKPGYDLSDWNKVLENEIEEPVNFMSWWYCCMPLKVISDTNLPLPIFIKRDDIEYGLRNGHQFIHLNGICIWHEPFEWKRSSYLAYYYFRNLCIINARHRPEFNGNALIRVLRRRIFGDIRHGRLRDAVLGLIGIQDYLNGISWLQEQDGELLHQEIMSLARKKQSVIMEYMDIGKKYCRVVRQVRRGYQTVTQEYRDRYHELTDLSFWQEYLK